MHHLHSKLAQISSRKEIFFGWKSELAWSVNDALEFKEEPVSQELIDRFELVKRARKKLYANFNRDTVFREGFLVFMKDHNKSLFGKGTDGPYLVIEVKPKTLIIKETTTGATQEVSIQHVRKMNWKEYFLIMDDRVFKGLNFHHRFPSHRAEQVIGTEPGAFDKLKEPVSSSPEPLSEDEQINDLIEGMRNQIG